MSKIIIIVTLIFCLSLILGTGASAVNAPLFPQPKDGSSGFVPPDTSVLTGGPDIGPNPLVKTPVSVQTGIVRTPVVIPGKSDATSESAPTSRDVQMISQLNPAQYAPDRLIVKLKPGLFSSSAEMAKAQSTLNDQMGVTVLDDAAALGVEGMQVVQIPKGSDLQSVAKLFSMNPYVEYAEPDYVLSIENGIVPGKTVIPPSVSIPSSGSNVQSVQKPPGSSSSPDARTLGVDDALSVVGGETTTISATLTPAGSSVKPNDPYFTKLYGLHNTGQTGGTSDADIDAPEAWAITRGSPAVRVAVIDTGVDYNHPDLKANCIAGYDYANNDADPMDDNGHGTHVAGTIAAIGNNAIGVAGVTWNTKIIPLKFLSGSGSGYTSNAIKAINYAKQHGATIASCSWGGSGTDKALQDAIANAPGILFVCAAGNSGKNTDIYPQSPASLPNANILAVAASDAKDKLASFSNYGAKSVDVAAPGVSILSTTPERTYAYMSGTSMATPHVSGIAALIKAKKPSLTTNQVKDLIIRYVDKKSAFSGKTVSGGRVNAYLAVKYA